MHVPLDETRSVPEGEGVVLLYDQKTGAYYRESLSTILDSVMRSVNGAFSVLAGEFDSFKAEVSEGNAAFRKEMSERQNRFIADVSEANQSIIELVKNGK